MEHDCTTCKFSVPRPIPDENGIHQIGRTVLECRESPPQVMMIMGEQKIIMGFPQVGEGLWCHRHRERSKNNSSVN